MDLNQMAEKVNSKKSFLEFVSALSADWFNEEKLEKQKPSSPYDAGVLGWQNGSIGSFLDAMQAWASDSGDKISDKPDWNLFARILLAGKFYE